LAYHGDAFAAGPSFGPDDAIVEIVAPQETTTSAPTTSSTAAG
jgi:hypothetical protein